jgi:NADH-quinone oxidoreductase subunit J
VLALVGHLLSLAALFLLLRAEFLAAAQVVVYAGAVMVLYVFVVAYIGGSEPEVSPLGPSLRPVAIVFVGAILVELVIALTGTGLKALDTDGAPYQAATADTPGFGSPEQIGELLLTKFLLPFELASILLLIAAVGAVVLARRRRGAVAEPEGVEVYSVMDALRPAGTGTMREAVSGIPEIHGPQAGTDAAATRPEVPSGNGARSANPTSQERGW